MMAVPESEEVGFKRIGLSASDYDASLPIKKRRFLVVQSPPSPSKDISSFHPDVNLLKTERSSPPKDVSSFHPNENLMKTERSSLSLVTLASSSSAVTSSGLSYKNEDCVSDENKEKSDNVSCYVDMVQSEVGMPGVKFQEPSLGGRDCFNGYVECEDKSLVTEKNTVRASPEILGGMELSSTSLVSDPLAGHESEEIDVKKPEEKCSSPICQVAGGAGVSVGLEGHTDPKLVPEKSDSNFLKQNSLEPVLLDLSLNKQGSSSTHCVKGNVGSDYDGSLLHSKRENWDLNTSMESWEACTSDAPVGQISASRTNMAIETYARSSERVENDSPCGKPIPLDSEHKDNSINACIPSKNCLHLSLNSSYPKSMLEEDPYISEYESDSNWDIAEGVDDDDNNIEEEYEDGEVRETTLETEVEKREIEPLDHPDCDDKKINSVGLPDRECLTSGSLEQETKPENMDVRSDDDVHTTTKIKFSEQENDSLCVKELHAVEDTISEDVKRPVKAAGRSQLFEYDKKDNIEGQDTADKIVDGIEDLIPTVSQGEVENAIAIDVVQNKDLTLPNVDESVNSDDAKDITGGTRNSRIINFHRASADSTPCKEKPSFVRSVLSRTDREFVPSMAVEGGANVQPRERDDAYKNITKKISADRHHDQSPWMNFSHRRGRSTNRLDTQSGEWDFGANFSPETYSDQQMDYHVPGLDQNRYKMIPDGSFGGANRRGRQLLDDEEPFFFHGPSRRKSPGRRHGPSVRGGKMVNRMPRDFSPSRCMDEGGSFDRQHGEKFNRNFADDTVDSIYPRPQPPYDVDSRPFFRERRNFSFQRKTFPRIDSKSPVRSRARSPSQWFSSKRSDRFCGRSEMTHRRSPNYRTDRMRSPDQRPIRGHMAGRRQGFRFLSPTDDLRDVGPAPDHGHMRPIIPNRNQTERLPHRNRSFDGIDPRGRIESDEVFDGPVRSGQMSGYSGGEPDDDERRFNERHGSLHSFQQHPFDDSDGERFRNNGEDCSRPFRFCAENDSRVSWKRR